MTVQYLKEQSHRYSHVRVWGSVGFIVSVTALGFLFDVISIRYLIPISWVLLVLIWLNCVTLRESPSVVHAKDDQHWFDLLKRHTVIAFFMAAFLLQFAFGAYYSFFSLYLENYDYSRSTIGILWAIGVIAEVLLFLVMHKMMPKMGVAYLLFVSLLLTALRWFITAREFNSQVQQLG